MQEPAASPPWRTDAEGFAVIEDVLARARRALRPPDKLTLSQWADRFYYLSAVSSAYVGPWRTIGYQRGIMDALTDPEIAEVYLMKSARVGATKILNAFVGFSVHHDPTSVLIVQPTLSDAKEYSKEELEPMFEDCPALAPIAFQTDVEEDKKKSNTILHMRFQGGAIVSLIGAVSARGFRRVSRRRVLMDEVDEYEVNVGRQGDPIRLAIKRSATYHDRKAYGAGTPTIKGASRIEALYESGDQRRYHVACPQCGHRDFLVWTRRETGGGHHMMFDAANPRETAHFVCSRNGCIIEERFKRQMIEGGEWVAQKPFRGKASFHIWAGYSLNPGDTWGQLAEEFVAASKDVEALKTFVNTALGETWEERGDAPEYEPLFARREPYRIGTVPAGVAFLTCGVDVQQDRWVYEVVGWSGGDKESWSIDAGVIPGDPNTDAEWVKLDALLNRQFPCEDGTELPIMHLAVDSGYATQRAYSWVRSKPKNRVVAVKGKAEQRTIITQPSKIEVNINGKAVAAGARLWLVGTNVAKTELYGWLRLKPPAQGAGYAPGWLHFPEYDEEYFKQLTSEHLVARKVRGFQVFDWHLLPGRENHWLDCRVYARASAAILGIDRLHGRPKLPARAPPSRPAAPAAAPAAPEAPAAPGSPPRAPRQRGGFWARRRRE